MFRRLNANRILHGMQYIVVDDTFTSSTIDIVMSDVPEQDHTVIGVEMALIQEYSGRHANVAKNIAKYYLTTMRFNTKWHDAINMNKFSTWKDKIDYYRPNIKFGTKYYPCILRQLKQLTFGGNGYGNKTKNI